MKGYMQEYINSIESKNSRKVANYVLRRIEDDNIQNYNTLQMEHLILNMQPNSTKEIITIVYILASYFKWLRENGIIDSDTPYQIVQSIDKNLLWKKAKPNAKGKFISYEQYERIVKDVATFEEYNSLYFELLFSCVYHGIYSDDLSVIKNLRRSDIQNDGVVTLRKDNGHTYKIKIPERLANDLIKLSGINEWLRPNRFGVCHVKLQGVHSDSVFKIENRSSNSEDSCKFSYYSKLRKISKEYCSHPLLPAHLYASGVMHRIKVKLEKEGISLEEAFSSKSQNKTAFHIIEKELIRSNSVFEMSNFRELVKPHLDAFC